MEPSNSDFEKTANESVTVAENLLNLAESVLYELYYYESGVQKEGLGEAVEDEVAVGDTERVGERFEG